jgi:hypothetical protein
MTTSRHNILEHLEESRPKHKVIDISKAERVVLGRIFRSTNHPDDWMDFETFRAKNEKSRHDLDRLVKLDLLRLHNQQKFEFTLLGLFALAEGRTPGAGKKIEDCRRIFRSLRKHYTNEPKHPISLRALAAASRIDVANALEAYAYLKAYSLFTIITPPVSEESELTPFASILEDKNLDGFIKKYAEMYQRNIRDRTPLFGTTVPSNLDSYIARSLENSAVIDRWTKSIERANSDPESAITGARALLEEVCKGILQEHGYPENDRDFPQLFGEVSKLLDLDPKKAVDDALRELTSGCFKIVNGLSALRNRAGDAHGRAPGSSKPPKRHAWLAVGLAGICAAFLMESLDAKRSI